MAWYQFKAIDHGLVKDTVLLAANEELSLKDTTPPGNGRKKKLYSFWVASRQASERKDTH